MNSKLAKKVAVAIAGSSQDASVIHLNESDFYQTIGESPVPILVDFSAAWCGPCRMIVPVLDEIAKEQADVVKIAKVPLNAAAQRLIEDYLALTGHRTDMQGALFRPVKNTRTGRLDRHLDPASVYRNIIFQLNRD
jgi:thiol-disulfide isomerase/thioredoxin